MFGALVRLYALHEALSESFRLVVLERLSEGGVLASNGLQVDDGNILFRLGC